jgi:erythromycin esterase-like protein
MRPGITHGPGACRAQGQEYYRNIFRREASSWNLRDTQMMESPLRLTNHLSRDKAPAKVIVWAHNSHLGDARATQMRKRGELNLGQVVREHFRKEAVSIGFTTCDGTVTAASDWTLRLSAEMCILRIAKVTNRFFTKSTFQIFPRTSR